MFNTNVNPNAFGAVGEFANAIVEVAFTVYSKLFADVKSIDVLPPVPNVE